MIRTSRYALWAKLSESDYTPSQFLAAEMDSALRLLNSMSGRADSSDPHTTKQAIEEARGTLETVTRFLPRCIFTSSERKLIESKMMALKGRLMTCYQ